jgi:hypothetical protein
MSSGRIRSATSAFAAAVLAALLVLAIPERRGAAPGPVRPVPAPAAAPATVEFAPTADGAHTAWLVAGPFSRALAEPEKAPPAREGAQLAGRPCQLLPWPDPGVQLPAGGVCYAAGTLVSSGGPR